MYFARREGVNCRLKALTIEDNKKKENTSRSREQCTAPFFYTCFK